MRKLSFTKTLLVFFFVQSCIVFLGPVGSSYAYQAGFNCNGGFGDAEVGTDVPVRVELVVPSDNAISSAEIWVAVETPFADPYKWLFYSSTDGWGVQVVPAGVFNVQASNSLGLLNFPLPAETYTFYALIDPLINGNIDFDPDHLFSTTVTVVNNMNGSIPSAGDVSSEAGVLLPQIEPLIPDEQRSEIDSFVSSYSYSESVPYTISGEQLEIHPQSPADLYRLLSIVAAFQGSLSGATWTALKGVLLDPSDPYVLAQAGFALNAAGRYSDAEPFMLRARDLQGGDIPIAVTLAMTFMGEGKNSEALSVMSEVLGKEPANSIYLNLLAGILRASGDKSAANNVLAMAHQINPEDKDVADSLKDPSTSDTQVPTPPPPPQPMDENFYNCFVAFMGCVDELNGKDGEADDSLISSDGQNFDRFWDQCEQIDQDGMKCGMQCDSEDLVCQATCEEQVCCKLRPILGEYVDNGKNSVEAYLTAEALSLKNYLSCVSGMLATYGSSLTEDQWNWVRSSLSSYLALHFYGERKILKMELDELQGTTDGVDRVCKQAKEDVISAQETVTQQQQALNDLLDAIDGELFNLNIQMRHLFSGGGNSPSPNTLETCFDGIGCIGGNDQGKWSITVGKEFVFAKFTVDTSHFGFGARIGLGVGDPTGGNIAGESLSFGGYVDKTGGSYIDLKAEMGGCFGSCGKSLTLFSVKQK